MKKICAITMARNDDFFLERWISYYGSQLGTEHLYILLDGLDQNAPINSGAATIKKLAHSEGQVIAADKARISLINNEVAELFKRYDLVIGTDADEFLVVDPNCGKSLCNYLSSIKINTSVSGIGIDIGQKLGVEKKIDGNLPFLTQREYAVVASRYTKPAVIAKQVCWGAGFHRVKNHNFKIDKHLYLFHFGCVDYEMIEQKLKDNEKLAKGWERHLKKRAKTIELVSKKKALNADVYIPIARILQTLLRPLFAWNKPTMGCWKLVIKIPKRFKEQPWC